MDRCINAISETRTLRFQNPYSHVVDSICNNVNASLLLITPNSGRFDPTSRWVGRAMYSNVGKAWQNSSWTSALGWRDGGLRAHLGKEKNIIVVIEMPQSSPTKGMLTSMLASYSPRMKQDQTSTLSLTHDATLQWGGISVIAGIQQTNLKPE